MILDSGQKTILLHKEDQNSSDFDVIYNTLQKDPCNSEKESIYYIYRQLRNAEPPEESVAQELIKNLFFSEKRYDLGEVGRYRINAKLYTDIPANEEKLTTRVLTESDIIRIIKSVDIF